jgi:cell division protein FtsW
MEQAIDHKLSQLFKGDKYIWFVIIVLSLFSIAAVFSSTGSLVYKSADGNLFAYLSKHAFMLFAGLGAIFVLQTFNYRIINKIAVPFLILAIGLLAYTLAFGANINQASRWISVFGFTIQTSDIAKLALFIFLSNELSKRQENIKNLTKGLLPIIAGVGPVVGLIGIANMSTALMLTATSILIMIIGRADIKQIIIVGLVAASILTSIIMLGPRRQTYVSRVQTFLYAEDADPDKAYQSNQSKIAIATSGLIGKGPGNSVQRNFLPHPYSDFIFAIIIEEYGSIVAMMIVLLYMIFLYRSVIVITKAPKAFEALLATGLSFSLVIQAFSNMAVAVGLFPVTGVPLPLLSMGGTSIIFTCIALGIILSVSREVENMQVSSQTQKVRQTI